MKYLGLILVLVLYVNPLNAQIKDSILVYGERFTEHPVFIYGNDEGFANYMDNTMVYPDSAKLLGIEGTVNVVFTIDTTGLVTEQKTVGKYIGYGLEEEAIRLIKSTNGMWQPGKEFGKVVQTRLRFPMKFKLTTKSSKNHSEISGNTTHSYRLPVDFIYQSYHIDEAPVYPGGKEKLTEFLNKCIPLLFNEESEVTRIGFVVETNGSTSNYTILIDGKEERLEKSMSEQFSILSGEWKPATFKGLKVRSYLEYPVTICFH
ncbi:MAG: hypothetical protein COA58_03455 [Bacteroidetes bacterium]|nr:MAG: hypothetical protein COA58_03455 [Bacteroidota bacterium]